MKSSAVCRPNQQPAPPKLVEITASELKRRLDRGDDIQVIDVREPHEYEIARLPGTTLIPLGAGGCSHERDRSIARDNPALQGWRAQRESDRGAAASRVCGQPGESEGRDYGVVQRRGSGRAEVLVSRRSDKLQFVEVSALPACASTTGWQPSYSIATN